jgi:hypothetical protein
VFRKYAATHFLQVYCQYEQQRACSSQLATRALIGCLVRSVVSSSIKLYEKHPT